MITKKLILFLLTGIFMLPLKTQAALEHMFLYFPDDDLSMTPASVQLDFEDVYFQAEDGTRLHGWYLPGAPGQKLVLFCHGNAGNISHRVDNLRMLHELGLAIFIFDYRGYGQSDGKASEAGTYSDARGALNWLRTRGWTEERLVYFGRSLGGAIALQLAIDNPPSGLVLESTFTSIEAIGKELYPWLWRLAGWALDVRYDNLSKIDRVKSPLLIFHGERDEIIPYKMGLSLYERASEPKRFHAIPLAGHNNTYEAGGQDYWNSWKQFISTLTTGD